MSTILVDQYGQPLTADPIGPMYGPIRFEDQPAWVRRRGRKGKALSRRGGRKTARTARGSRRSSRKSARRSSNRTDYRRYLAARSETYGPVRFEDQPRWVRRRGRKSLNRGNSALRTRRSRRRSARSARGSSRTLTRRQKRKLNRQLARSTSRRSSKRSRRGASKRRSARGSRRSVVRRARRSTRLSKRGASKVLSYSKLMSQLRRKPKLKAWVCVGRKRTGCGGGRKGGRGSRQFGVLRP